MKRRQVIRYGGMVMATTIATTTMSRKSVLAMDDAIAGQQDGILIQYLGHTCFLFTGSGLQVLVNPYQSLGCTAGYTLPRLEPDVVLISSFLLDEGAVEAVQGNPEVITQRGPHQFGDLKFQGFALDHDRDGGRRFGKNIAWRWNQGGVNLLHLGGAAGSLSTENKILLNGADILLAPVGGSAKAYNAAEARQVVKVLNPKMVIPTHYRTDASPADDCELTPVDDFLELAADLEVAKVGSDRFRVKKSYLTSEQTLVRVLDYTS